MKNESGEINVGTKREEVGWWGTIIAQKGVRKETWRRRFRLGCDRILSLPGIFEMSIHASYIIQVNTWLQNGWFCKN